MRCATDYVCYTTVYWCVTPRTTGALCHGLYGLHHGLLVRYATDYMRYTTDYWCVTPRTTGALRHGLLVHYATDYWFIMLGI